VAIHYRIEPFDPAAHLFRVGLLITGAPSHAPRLTLALPAWIPGSYMIREFARNIVSLRARDAVSGQRLALRKIAKAHWEIDTGPGAALAGVVPAAGSGTMPAAGSGAVPAAGSGAVPVAGSGITQGIQVEAEVYAWELSVRTAHLDQRHGFFNPTSLCLRVVDFDHLRCTVELVAPDAQKVRGIWQVATTLQPAPGGAEPWGFGHYLADDYADLADHPVEMGSFARHRFIACATPHDVVITGHHRCDADRLCHDMQRICEAQVRLFDAGGKAPFDRYLFLITALDDGYGGLEHRDSSALLCRRSDLPGPGSLALDSQGTPLALQPEVSEGYRRFLGLASHEYFHAWHVKRIQPQAFVRCDFDRENYSRLLWIFEGFTSYYDDLMLLRAGVISASVYLQALEDTVNQVLTKPSRQVQSLTEASFDAWIKYYRQDENASNAVLSYYAKGALVALCIDIMLSGETHGQRSLDDVMRMLWQRFGHNPDEKARNRGEDSGNRGEDSGNRGGDSGNQGDRSGHQGEAFGSQAAATAPTAQGSGPAPRGLTEAGFTPLLLEACHVTDPEKCARIAAQIHAWTDDTVELPLEEMLATVGVRMRTEAQPRVLGMQTVAHGTGLFVKSVVRHAAAQRAGIAAGDQLVAIQGLKASDETLAECLRRESGPLEILVFRRDELMRFEVLPQADEHPKAKLGFAKDDGEGAWLRFACRP